MDRRDCVATIRYECIAGGGFLARLRGREFSAEHYDKLIQALRAYREMIRGQDWIERVVAYCLYYLDLDLRAALDFFPRTEEERALMSQAQLECSELILEILTPEYMTGPIPDELAK